MLKNNNRIIETVMLTVISVLCILFASTLFDYTPSGSIDQETQTATVVEILEVTSREVMDDVYSTEIIFTAELTSGERKGETVQMLQTVDEFFFPTPQQVEPGDNILASDIDVTEDGEDNRDWYYTGHNRMSGIVILVVVFALLILFIGGFKGVTAVISLAVTVGMIFYVYIPSILTGVNIYMSTILVTGFAIFSNLMILNGINQKTFIAITGNVGGILAAGVLAILTNNALGITGAVDQEYMFLSLLDNGVSIDLKGLVWGGILIGSLGAVMDIAMSISSAMQELSEQMKEKSFGALVRSGMNIGRDCIGTMTNTLILAYIGSSLAMVLLFAAYNRELIILMNFEMILVEIIQAVVGSIGILMAVPVTVLYGAWVHTRDYDDDYYEYVYEDGDADGESDVEDADLSKNKTND